MALLEAQEALWLDAEGLQLKARAGGPQRPPDVHGVVRREMNLVTELTDETHAHDAAGRPGDESLADPEVGERPILEIERSVLREHRTGVGSCEVERAVVSGEVHEADRQAPPGREATELAEQRRGVTGRGR